MSICKKCGAQLADEAKICRECGAVQSESQKTEAASGGDFFSMPYLSASQPKPDTAAEKKTETEESPSAKATAEWKKEKRPIDQLTDPRERAFAKQDRRNKLIRIIVLVVILALLISGGLYLLLRNSGYRRTLDQYIDGRTSSGGSKYTAIVPETYLIQAEKDYAMARPDIRSTVTSYLAYVESQIEADYGSGVTFSYQIISENSTDDDASTEALEETILSTYGTDVSVTEVANVSIRLTTKGSETQTTETKRITFFECDGRWCCLDAMQVIQFACENAGYQLW